MKKKVRYSERLGRYVMYVSDQERDVYGYYKIEAAALAAMDSTAALVKANKPLDSLQ